MVLNGRNIFLVNIVNGGDMICFGVKAGRAVARREAIVAFVSSCNMRGCCIKLLLYHSSVWQRIN